jgi:hypothetical protein
MASTLEPRQYLTANSLETHMIYARLYETERAARDAVTQLKQEGFPEETIFLVTPDSNREAGSAETLATAIQAGFMEGYDARIYAQGLEAGRSLVMIRAGFGYGLLALNTLETCGPVDTDLLPPPADLGRRGQVHAPVRGLGPAGAVMITRRRCRSCWVSCHWRPAPCSTARLASTCLARRPPPCPPSFTSRLLRARPAPGRPASGCRCCRKQPTPKSSSFGLPLLSAKPAPLSSMFGLPILTSDR